MKTIEINNKQKENLLEMCKVLFPEYTFITFQNEAIMGAGWGYNFNNICFSNKSNKIFDIEQNIHWFEFVIAYLVQKIQDNLPEDLVFRNQPEYVGNVYSWKEGNKWTMYSEFFFLYPKKIYEKHPIDYLYEEFKKFKELK